ncbi:unnamed protein product [Dovyalis caffra]|uniref:TIR domain-containing protein n=1 Tax=Dovyalis caffra TaxID=77055 RepID=A0AAV1QMR2_9ROSI|nr:unnamed protein product [Dovyalis caffra]
MASSSSSTLTTKLGRKRRVFLSFSGEDTRVGFTSHLHAALERRNILTFIDDDLKRGEEISDSLVKAIEGPMISVDPFDVRKQSGSFGNAFTELVTRKTLETEEERCFRAALNEATNISGHDSRKIESESKFIEEIVKDIFNKLSKMFSIHPMNLVGIDERLRKIESFLEMESQDVRIELAYSIASEESENPRKRSRLVDPEDIYNVLKKRKCFPRRINSKNIKRLSLRDCSNIKKGTKISRDMEVVDLSRTAIQELQQSFGDVRAELFLSGCSHIAKFPEISGNMRKLCLDGTSIEEVPSSIQFLSNLRQIQPAFLKKMSGDFYSLYSSSFGEGPGDETSYEDLRDDEKGQKLPNPRPDSLFFPIVNLELVTPSPNLTWCEEGILNHPNICLR